jgi:hypothetical protein
MWRNNTMRTPVATRPKYANVSGAFESRSSQHRNTTRKQSMRTQRLTTQWSGRPTAQALCQSLAPYLWAAAHRERWATGELWTEGLFIQDWPMSSGQPCIFTRGDGGDISVTRDRDVIDRPASGPSRPQRSLGRRVHSFESPNRCPEPCSPYLARPGQSGVVMSATPRFGGIDVAKAQLDIALRPTGRTLGRGQR